MENRDNRDPRFAELDELIAAEDRKELAGKQSAESLKWAKLSAHERRALLRGRLRDYREREKHRKTRNVECLDAALAQSFIEALDRGYATLNTRASESE